MQMECYLAMKEVNKMPEGMALMFATIILMCNHKI